MAFRNFLLLVAATGTLAAPGLVQRSAELPIISASAVPAAVIDDAPKPTLQPITPPASNAEDLDILTPDKKVSLFYKSRPVVTKRSDSEDATEDSTLAELDFTFQHPSIPLDHSSFVSTVICGSNDLTATFADSTGFDYAETSWPKDSQLILITSTTGCGPDDQNGLFLADTVTFSDADSSVSATGSFVEVPDIMDTLDIQWGKISAPAQSNATSNSSSTDYGCTTCGPTFDQDLDASLGYYGGDQATITAEFAPGTTNGTSANVQRRGIFDAIGDLIDDAVDVISDGAEAVADGVSDAVDTIVDGATEIVDTVGDVISDVVDDVVDFAGEVVDGITDALDGDYSQSVTLEIDVFAHYLNDADYANDLASSDSGDEEEEEHEAPWENAFLLYSFGAPDKEEGTTDSETASSGSEKMRRDVDIASTLEEREVSKGLNLYCVDCGVKGSITTEGSISLTLQGIDECKVSVHGNLEAGLFLGMEMFVAFEEKYEKSLIKKSLLGWEIPGIIVFGPYASLGVEAGVEIKAEGTVLLGAKAEWSGFEATLDLLDADKSTQSGWTPEVTRKFEAEGKIGVEATLGLPVAVGVGVDLLDGKWKKAVELKDTPAIVAEAEFEMSIKHESTTGADGTETSETETDINDGCYGVAWNIHLKNELEVDLLGIETFTLNEWEGEPLAEGCIGYEEPDDEDEEGSDESSDDANSGASPDDSTGDDTGSDSETGEDAAGNEDPSDAGSDDTNQDGSPGSDQDESASGNSGSDGSAGEETDANPAEDEGSNGDDSTGGDAEGSDGTGQDNSGSDGTDSGNDGTDSGNGGTDSDNDGISDGSTGEGSTPTDPDTTPVPDTPTPQTCKGPVTKVKASLTGGATCGKRTGRFIPGGRARIGGSFKAKGNKVCARSCLNEQECQSFAFNPKSKVCSLFRQPVQNLHFASGTKLSVNDVACFQTEDCSVSDSSVIAKRASGSTAQITDLTGTFKLVPSEDGNIEVAFSNDTAASAPFASVEGLIVGDSSSRILHYYPETMASSGVSRLRLASVDSLPATSEFVALVPVAAEDGTKVLVAMDTEGQASFLTVCSVENVGNKIFLVDDVATAEEKLMAEGVRDEVTGGVVKQCAALAMTV